MRTPVTLVAGLDREAARRLARRLVATDPGRVLVEHDLTQVDSGLVGRTLEWGDGRVEAAVTELAHGCVSCTLREDVLPLLVDLAEIAGHCVLLLPDVVEVAGFTEAFHGLPLPGRGRPADRWCRISRVVTVVDGEELVDVIEAGETLAETGRVSADADADDRTLGEVLVRQVESADILVTTWAGAHERALLRLLNPTATLLTGDQVATDVLPEDVFDLESLLDRCDPSVPPALPEDRTVADAWTVAWRARGPAHPARLEEALTEVSDACLRSRGTIWIAGHPQSLVGWDGVGPRICLGAAGTWLDGGQPCAHEHAHPHHRVRAELDWHPRFGDRYQELVLTRVGPLPEDALAALQAALLTEPELRATADGRTAPAGEDPFAEVFADPDHPLTQESA